uniref:AlNc14C61G4477 protein n=1 Tax=Albugo laibachii Nc14 TaxID=890382 RepID=F0WCV1_9STRA|nr:AlNc14C61G4477 [Albugo laibachii Nc14]|eukprot:CCA19020.1 AlNc14C61G4477 [Albugo laibachii Nc14]
MDESFHGSLKLFILFLDQLFSLVSTDTFFISIAIKTLIQCEDQRETDSRST